ncbi:hypothetical protein GCM10011368_09820 [Hyunsoonleella pacifica]|nr:hypothetical protein GCM10011368_09820 [Hyunsoonleella pacifica]
MDLGIVKLGINLKEEFTSTTNVVIKAINDTALKTLITSAKPVCRITLLKEPTNRKLIIEITKRIGV